MGNLREQAQELLALGAYKWFIANEYNRLHGELGETYAELGVTEQQIVSEDGAKLGMVSLGDPVVEVEVLDEDAMLDYVSHAHPGEMVERTVYEVRPAFLRVLTEGSRKARRGIDPTTGEELPWLRVTVKPGSVRVTPSPAARERVKEIVAQRGLRLELDA
jgi:hypothetical protein